MKICAYDKAFFVVAGKIQTLSGTLFDLVS